MAGQIGGDSPILTTDHKLDLRLELTRHGREFSFFQLIRLLRLLKRQSIGNAAEYDTSQAWRHIRVQPELSLGFPSADVSKVEEKGDPENPSFWITASFLSLYGSASPLPTFYTEDLIAEQADDESVMREFFNLINQRLFGLLFQCWSKYRQHLQIVEEQQPEHIERLFCLLGLGEPEFRQSVSKPQQLLRYIGLFNLKTRSSIGLKTLLRDALSLDTLEIIPCVARMAKIPTDQRLRLGVSGHRLGFSSYLGEQIPDRQGKFRLRLGPLDKAAFERLVPGTKDFERLTALTDLYVVSPLEYDVEVVLTAGQVQTVCLGNEPRATLGINTWVFSHAALGEVRTIFSPHYT